MSDGNVFASIDLAEIALWAFTLFFLGLIFYLRREDRREGYPLEQDTTGRVENPGVWMGAPKRFRLPHGAGVATSNVGDARAINATRVAPWAGAPFEPVGDPMLSSFGPGAYAERADVPDLMWSGEPRLAPLRDSPAFFLHASDPDPRGMTVYGCDRVAAGIVADVWVDRAEMIIRYLEVEVPLDDAGSRVRRALVPMPFAVVDGRRRRIEVEAVRGRQFRDAPSLASPGQITLLEEDKICAYFGGGLLYAIPQRREALL